MGANFSNFDEKSLKSFIQNEFEKQKGSKKRDYLVLADILSVSLPDDYTFNFNHIGNLFSMDANKDGRFSHDDLMTFASLSIKEVKKYK